LTVSARSAPFLRAGLSPALGSFEAGNTLLTGTPPARGPGPGGPLLTLALPGAQVRAGRVTQLAAMITQVTSLWAGCQTTDRDSPQAFQRAAGGALWLLSVTDRWRVVLTRRGMPRLSDLLPEVTEPGGPADDLDAWLDFALTWAAVRRGVPEIAVAGVAGPVACNFTASLGVAALVWPLAVGAVSLPPRSPRLHCRPPCSRSPPAAG